MKDKKDSLGDRMKGNYENRTRFYLTRRTPVIIRLDGKAFHTLTRHCDKPFDANFIDAMKETARYLCENIQGCKLGYVQSDEISLLLTDFDLLTTDAWFDHNLQKMCSVSASMATVMFNKIWQVCHENTLALFDSRCFNIPKEEVANYFVWRQKDWIRNSVQMLAQAYFSHKELHKKKVPDMHEMLYTKGVNWANLSPHLKNGTTFIKMVDGGWLEDSRFIASEGRVVIEQLLILKE